MKGDKAMLWLSGWSVPAEIWEEQLRFWPEYAHETIDFNQCHHVEEMRHLLLTAYHKLPAAQVIIIGWSLGAMIALEQASLFDERLQALFLVGGVERFIRSMTNPHNWDQRILKRMKKQLDHQPNRVLQNFDQKMFSSAEIEHGYDSAWKKTVRNRLPQTEPLKVGLDYISQFDVSAIAHQIQVPVYLLSGDEDVICPKSSAQHLASKLLHGKLTIWENTGHVPFWTQPERFHLWIKEALNVGCEAV